MTISAVVAPESLSSNQQSILWIETITARIVDERPAPRLTFSLPQADETAKDRRASRKAATTCRRRSRPR